MRWWRLAGLLNSVRDEADAVGRFSSDADGEVVRRQRGVVRTNCMDNLDRTNVVQSLFARRALLDALPSVTDKSVSEAKRLDGLRERVRGGDSSALQEGVAPGTRVRAGSQGEAQLGVLDSPDPELEKAFKNLWADNADRLSNLYGGAPAQKTDFTRTGQRTTQGMIADASSGIARFFINHFSDAEHQDAWDLFTGQYSDADSDAGAVARSMGRGQSRQGILGERRSRPTAWKVFGGLVAIAAVVSLSAAVVFGHLWHKETELPLSTAGASMLQLATDIANRAKPFLGYGALVGMAAFFGIGFAVVSKGSIPGMRRFVAQPALCPEQPLQGFDRHKWSKRYGSKKAAAKK